MEHLHKIKKPFSGAGNGSAQKTGEMSRVLELRSLRWHYPVQVQGVFSQPSFFLRAPPRSRQNLDETGLKINLKEKFFMEAVDRVHFLSVRRWNRLRLPVPETPEGLSNASKQGENGTDPGSIF